MYDHTLDIHVEEHGLYQPPLSGAVSRPELGAMLSALLYDHLLVIPKIFSE